MKFQEGEDYPFDKTKKGAEPEAREESVTREMPESSDATITDSGGISAGNESCLISILPPGNLATLGVRFNYQSLKREITEAKEGYNERQRSDQEEAAPLVLQTRAPAEIGRVKMDGETSSDGGNGFSQGFNFSQLFPRLEKDVVVGNASLFRFPFPVLSQNIYIYELVPKTYNLIS